MTPERRDFIRREHARTLTIIEAEGRRGRVTAHHRTEYECEGCGFTTTDAGTIFDHACPPTVLYAVAATSIRGVWHSDLPALEWFDDPAEAASHREVVASDSGDAFMFAVPIDPDMNNDEVDAYMHRLWAAMVAFGKEATQQLGEFAGK